MSFGVNDEVISQPKPFGVSDEVVKTGFGTNDEIIHPANPVMFQNRTRQDGLGELDLNQRQPTSYGDAVASGMIKPGGMVGTNPSEVLGVPARFAEYLASGLLNAAAEKSYPDTREQYNAFKTAQGHPASHLRNALQQAIFGPSNLGVFGQDPNYKPFKAGFSMLPESTSQVGMMNEESSARKMIDGLTTPGNALMLPTLASKVGPVLGGIIAAQTAADLPNMSKEQIAQNALMMGVPMALHGGFGRPEELSRGASMVKEQRDINPVQILNDVKQPTSTTDSIMPVGDDNRIVARENATTVSRGTPSLALNKDGYYATVQHDNEVPGSGYIQMDEVKNGENIRSFSPEQAVKEGLKLPDRASLSSMDQGKHYLGAGSEQVGNQGMNPESGSVGLHVLDPEVWKELGFKVKVSGEQFINRLRNKLGGESAGWKLIDTPKLKDFLKVPRITDEVRDFVNNNGPKVEVRKFSNIATEDQKLQGQLQHEMETRGMWKQGEGPRYTSQPPSQDEIELLKRWQDVSSRIETDESVPNWQSIAPKSEKDMPGYTEIAIVKGKKTLALKDVPKGKENKWTYHAPNQIIEQDKFPSSHNFPPNTLGFVRGYMETTPQGKKVFHVIEVQSDWAQAKRQIQEETTKEGREYSPQETQEQQSRIKGLEDPLLPHYERLALKAAIDHAREQGADAIAISDAETAMMTEGHDRGALTPLEGGEYPEPDQAAGMRLHYDRTLPKIVEELTGEKGTKESFGEHRMALEGGRGLDEYTPLQRGPNLWRIKNDATGEVSEFTSEQAMEDFMYRQEEKGKFRKDLIFRNESGEPKTDITARVYPITKAAKDFSIIGKDKPAKLNETTLSNEAQQVWDEAKAKKTEFEGVDATHLQPEERRALAQKGLSFSENRQRKIIATYPAKLRQADLRNKVIGNQGVSGESGMLDLGGAKESLDKGIENLKEFFSEEAMRRKMMKVAGVSVPKTTAANSEVGNQLTMFAQAEGVAEAVARSKASEVLGSHWNDPEFAKKLGAVGVEDQLRTLKAQLLAQGKTAEAQNVNTVVGQPYSPIKSEAQYQQLKNAPDIKDALERHKQIIQPLAEKNQTALKGALRAPGQDSGAFFNLIAKNVDDGIVRKGRQGNTMATLKGGTRFGKEFKGTAAEYELDYRKMAERMVKGNWSEVEKLKLFDLVDKSGFGHLQKAGEDLPTFDKKMTPIPVQRRMAVIVKPGEKPIMKSQNETLWVPERSAEEFRQAFQTDSPIKNAALKATADVVNKVQTSLGADAAFHVGNMTAAVVTSPEKVTAVKLMVENLAKTFETNPEVQKKLASMAEEAGIVREGEDEVAAWRKLVPGRHMISWIDQAGRLTLDQLYKDAVKRGESPDSPIYRRAAVQGRLGEYNKKLQTRIGQIAKELGLSPFLTAGKTFNMLSVKQMFLSPGRKAATLEGGAKMRLRQAMYTVGLIVAAPLVINKMVTGNPMPPGVEPGQIVIKKKDDGSYETIDVAQLMMMRRGLRNTGIQAVAHGIQDKQSVGQIAKQAGKDIGRGMVRPYAGPLLGAADTTLGSDILADKPNEPSVKKRFEGAVKQLNPTAEVLLNQDESKSATEKAKDRFGRVFALKNTQTSLSRVNQLARQWKERNGVPVDDGPKGEYSELASALRKNDAEGARREMKQLAVTGKSNDLIKRYFDEYAKHKFSGSRENEERFVGELSEEDKKAYQDVKASNEKVRENFYNIFMGRLAPRLPVEGRVPRQKRGVQFVQ